MPRRFFVLALFLCAWSPLAGASFAFAQSSPAIQLSVNDLLSHASIFFSPEKQTVVTGATFNVSIYLNTYQNPANALDLTIQFPPDLLSVVQPSTGNSVIGIWLQPPSYSNSDGTIHISGVIPNGITTGGGLITTITFRALAPGNATVGVSDLSTVLANDGQGTPMATQFGQGTYTIMPTPPSGITIFSLTHPFSNQWYNNASPILGWNKGNGADAFSYLIDDKPFTVPDNKVETTSTSMAYQNLNDGIWYFHIKARKNGMWGPTTNFLLRIDTQPPAEFTPTVDMTTTAFKKVIVSFFTTDALSGINHYEVGVINAEASSTASPVFVESQSPYAFSYENPVSHHFHVVVRAMDNAGNVRDEYVDVNVPTSFDLFVQNNGATLVLGLLILVIFALMTRRSFGRKLAARMRRLIGAIKKEEQLEIAEETNTISGIERKQE